MKEFKEIMGIICEKRKYLFVVLEGERHVPPVARGSRASQPWRCRRVGPGTSLSWGCPVPCRKLSIPGLYAFDASSVPTIVTANGVLRRCQVFFGGQSCHSREPLCPAL